MKLSFKKPKRESMEKDEYEVEAWVRDIWPKIKAHVRRWQAMLYFQDESSIQLTSVLGKTWAPIGKTPKVKEDNETISENTELTSEQEDTQEKQILKS